MGKPFNLKTELPYTQKNFPEILNYIGQAIITTDGTTLLGADDKAGVAEIVTAAEILLKSKEIKHGKIRLAFTPDEEIGKGTDHFNVKKFGADFAYTLDGGEIGELEFENFNAAGAKVKIQGRSVHPGQQK
jgi:tripeptide aminopeptidase